MSIMAVPRLIVNGLHQLQKWILSPGSSVVIQLNLNNNKTMDIRY